MAAGSPASVDIPAGYRSSAPDPCPNTGLGSVTIVSDPDAPAVALVSPQDGEAVLTSVVAIDLNFAAATTLVAVNGAPDGRSFDAGFAEDALTLPLAFGVNVFTLDLEAGRDDGARLLDAEVARRSA